MLGKRDRFNSYKFDDDWAKLLFVDDDKLSFSYIS